MITIHNLTKTYHGNVQALRGINLEIQSRGMFGLLGDNGAGKTTLMRILAGVINPGGGQVSVFGNDMMTATGIQSTQSFLGYLPQETGVYPDLTAREFLDYIAILKGITDKITRERQIDKVLDSTHLSDVANRKLNTFSGGMKRRTGIAQALLGEPRLLIVDEPTSGLDPEGRVQFRNLLAEMANTCLVILSTHIVEDINHSCSDLAVIKNGTVLFHGTPADLIEPVRGKVWLIHSKNAKPPGNNLRIVSTRQIQNGTEYRVLGESVPDFQAVAVEPSLEDAYLWLSNLDRA
ncbi:MAG: ATP-binding cassette domain-containing protein [Anaerolineales bacterium]